MYLRKCWLWFLVLALALGVLGLVAIGLACIATQVTILVFGILLLASGAPDVVTAVERDVEALAKATGLTVHCRKTKSPEAHRRAATIPCVISVDALDHEGIVRAVSRALHGAGVNIVSLETTAYEAPVTGSQLFRMEARVDVPAGVTLAHVDLAGSAAGDDEALGRFLGGLWPAPAGA